MENLRTEYGISVNDLISFLEEYCKLYGDDGEVWLSEQEGYSNLCYSIYKLNKNDILLCGRNQ